MILSALHLGLVGRARGRYIVEVTGYSRTGDALKVQASSKKATICKYVRRELRTLLDDDRDTLLAALRQVGRVLAGVPFHSPAMLHPRSVHWARPWGNGATTGCGFATTCASREWRGALRDTKVQPSPVTATSQTRAVMARHTQKERVNTPFTTKR